MKLVIIGGVAAGTSAAAKARRNDETAEIKIFDQDEDMSYSVCGLPYYIGTEVETREQLVPRNAAFFKKKYNVDVYMGHQVVAIDPERKELTVKNLKSQEINEEHYDKLILATGATVLTPEIPGIDKENVFCLRNVISADRSTPALKCWTVVFALYRFLYFIIVSYYSSYNQKAPALFLQIKQELKKNMKYFLTLQPQEKQAQFEKDLHLPNHDPSVST